MKVITQNHLRVAAATFLAAGTLGLCVSCAGKSIQPDGAGESGPLVTIAAPSESADAGAAFAYAEALRVSDGGRRSEREVFEWYEKSATAGHSAAMVRIAHGYYEGKGVGNDFAKALEWYHRAADANQPPAMFMIGHMTERGEGTAKSIPQALAWYLEACKCGSADAALRLGEWCEEGIWYSTADGMSSIDHYRDAWRLGSVEALYRVAAFHFEVREKTGNDVRPFNWLTAAAENGHPEAMIRLAQCYDLGIGTPPDPAAVTEWLERAANTPVFSDIFPPTPLDPLSEDFITGRGMIRWYDLGELDIGTSGLVGASDRFRHGRGVPANPDFANILLARAAWSGSDVALKHLTGILGPDPLHSQPLRESTICHLLEQIDMGSKNSDQQNDDWDWVRNLQKQFDSDEYFRLVEACAQAEVPNAMATLGDLYIRGEGALPDKVKGAVWYQKSALAGDTYGMSWYASLLDSGEVFRQDRVEALRWFVKAAEGGSHYSAKRLGDFYFERRSDPRSAAEAVRWYERAIQLERNKESLLRLATLIREGVGTPADEDRAQQLEAEADGFAAAKAAIRGGS